MLDLGDDYEPVEFLSEEDRDLRHLSDEEFWAWWQTWFEQAQASNDQDAHHYSHGVFMTDPGNDYLADADPTT